ncbi:MAG TPA: ankyrin repeat domain-containing protein [Bryobacteraceae bacterium]|nr:ankyrin repeat domain-containing protein [Bryobacteraceae bacterium]
MFLGKAALFALTMAGLLSASTLSEAVQSGDQEQVQRLLKAHTNVNVADADGTTPLEWAVYGDDLETARLLLRAGANASTPNRYGVTPLSLAATNRNAAMAEALLKAGANANARLPDGSTMLMAAARTGNPEIVRLLIEHGADVNAKGTEYGETALVWAADQNHAEAAQALIAHGADVDARTVALQREKDRFGLEGVLTILPHGDWTPLMYAARQGSLDAARALVEAGAKLNLTDPDGTTALEIAIINGHYDTAAMLTEKGADPNLADSAGMGALYATVDMNTLGEVYGRPERPPTDKLTALDLVKILLDHGANPNARLKSPTLQRAHTPGDFTLGEGATPMMRAAKNGDAAAIRLLLAHGADPNAVEKKHTTALMFAAGLGRGTGAFTKDYATEAQLLEAVKVLVAAGADVNAVNDSGETPLHYGAQASDGIVKYLAEKGAKLDAKDRQGRTPVEMALGVGLHGHAGGPPNVREGTANLLRQLMAINASKSTPRSETLR